MIVKRMFAQSGLTLSIIPVGHSIVPSSAGAADDVVELVVREFGT